MEKSQPFSYRPDQDDAKDIYIDYLCRINQKYSYLSKSQKKIADYLNEHPDEISRCSISTLSKKIGTSPSSMSRFCQVLNYKGFSDMKFCAEKELLFPNDTIEFNEDDNLRITKKKYLNLYTTVLTDTLLNIKEQYILAAARALGRAEHVYIYSSGSSGAGANYAYQLFLQVGIPCNYFVDRQLGIMSLDHLKPSDVAIGMNFSGNSSVVMEIITLAKQKKATTIAITSGTQQPLSKLADIPLCYSTKISDDLRYIHAARMCELAIIGQIQMAYIQISSTTNRQSLQHSKLAIKKTRASK